MNKSKKQLQREIEDLNWKLDVMQSTAASLYQSGTTFLGWYKEALEVTLELIAADDIETLRRVASETLEDLNKAEVDGENHLLREEVKWN